MQPLYVRPDRSDLVICKFRKVYMVIHDTECSYTTSIGRFKCFRAGFWAFSAFKYRVKGGTNM